MAHWGSLPNTTSPIGMVNRLPPSSSMDMNEISGALIEVGSYARVCNRARRLRLRARARLRNDGQLPSDQPAAQPPPEQQRAECDGGVAVDKAPEQRVTGQQRTRNVNRHHRYREHLGEAGGSGRGSKIQQERDECLDEQDVEELRREAEGPHRDVAGQQLVGV